MDFKNILLYDDFFGLTTLEFYLNKVNASFNIVKSLNNNIINIPENFQNEKYLCFVFLNSFDTYSLNLIQNELKDQYLIINTNIPINVYYQNLSSSNILGYIDRANFDADTIKNLFNKINNNKIYISENDTELLLDFTYFNKSKSERNNMVKKLSLQEYIVLENLLLGKSVNQIAAELNLHKSSISTYKKRVLDKCAVSSIFDLKNIIYTNP
jgi:DNA-binding CsgD family transcriptional regulator